MKYEPAIDDMFIPRWEKEKLVDAAFAVLGNGEEEIPEDPKDAFEYGMNVGLEMVNVAHSGHGIADWKDRQVNQFVNHVLKMVSGAPCAGYVKGVQDAVKLMVIREKCFSGCKMARLVDALMN